MPVGETRPTADFYVSADLTRTSKRRLQAGNFLSFEELRSRFSYTFWSAGRSHTVESRVITHSTTQQIRHAASVHSGLDGSRGCACYVCRRRESTCGSTLRLDPETRGQPAVPCRGPASGILPLPRACCCCSPSTQAKETLMKEASAPPIIEEEKTSEKDASKNRAP